MQVTQVIHKDWLSKIDGLTVEKAIEYLKTLNPSDRIGYTLQGDTHGVDIEGYIEHDRPATDLEIQKYRDQIKENKIKAAQRQVDYFQRRLNDWIKLDDKAYIIMYTTYLSEAKAKLQELYNA